MFFKKKEIKASTDTSGKQIEMILEITETELQCYSTPGKIREGVSELIAKDIYPSIKSELLKSENFEKVINEVRLLTAKKLLND